MKKMLMILMLLVGTFIFQGCASIISGSTQSITLSSEPSRAKVRIGGNVFLTPATVELERKHNHSAIFLLEGYETQQVQITKYINPWIFGNIIIGGIPGIVIDLITGGAADLKPDNIHVIMRRRYSEKTIEEYLHKNLEIPARKEE